MTKYIDEMLEKLYAKLHNLEKDCRSSDWTNIRGIIPPPIHLASTPTCQCSNFSLNMTFSMYKQQKSG